MKIATWNIQRFMPRNQTAILNAIKEQDADILVLTEAFNTIEIAGCKNIKSKLLPPFIDGQEYKNGEIRTSIYSKFPIISSHETYNDYTSICVDIETQLGILTVYASIIGIVGNVQPYFNNDLYGQLKDYDKIFPVKENIIVIGDLNTTFSGRVFPSKVARNSLNAAFDKFNLLNLTIDLDNNVDHIVVSKNIVTSDITPPITWNKEKKISDHIGICVEI